MPLNVEKELAALQKMTPKELREKYAEVFGEASRSGNKQWLVKRIIWRMQANAEGGLSERALRRAMELANDADLRLKAPLPSRSTAAQAVTKPATFSATGRLPLPGSTITRQYKGRLLEVVVRENGFDFEGETYRSLSAVAKKITGTHTNGFLFFRLGEYGGAE
jgi:hypothetical protein